MYTRRRLLGAVGGGLTGIGLGNWVNRTTDAERFETAAGIYDTLGGEQIPTHEALRRIVKSEPNPEQYIQPDDDTVQRYVENLEPYEDGFAMSHLKDFEYVDASEQCGNGFCWNYPDETLETLEGNCVDYAITMASLLEADGYDARVVIGNVYWRGSCESENAREDCEPGLHAVAQARIDGDVYISDNATAGYILPGDAYKEYVREWTPITMFGQDTSYRMYDEHW